MAQAETGDLGTAQHVRSVLQALAIPKDSFTYEAIGVNVVKRITRLQKVWDLPQAPEDNVCPEVVFAGRSNVGKSSLVNMLLNRSAIAPTSSRPGRTKTMDFFDVNNGHPEPCSAKRDADPVAKFCGHGPQVCPRD
eukprot:g15496.t1